MIVTSISGAPELRPDPEVPRVFSRVTPKRTDEAPLTRGTVYNGGSGGSPEQAQVADGDGVRGPRPPVRAPECVDRTRLGVAV